MAVQTIELMASLVAPIVQWESDSMMAFNFNLVASSFYWPIGHIITYLLYLGCSDGKVRCQSVEARGRLSVCHVTPSSIHWWWWWSGTIMCKSSNVMVLMLCGNVTYMWKGFITFFVLPPYFFMLTHPYPFLQREKKPFLHPKHCYIAVLPSFLSALSDRRESKLLFFHFVASCEQSVLHYRVPRHYRLILWHRLCSEQS